MAEWMQREVTPEEAAVRERLDVYCSRHWSGFSRSQIGKAIRAEAILCNAHKAKPGLILQEGDVVSCDLSFFEVKEILPEPFTLPVLYEDDAIFVVNKPADLIVHPTDTVREHTLVNYLLGSGRPLAASEEERQGIVHRLDAQTSGAIIVAKTDTARDALQEMFRNHLVKKHYLALVEGNWNTPSEWVHAPLGRNPADPQKQAVLADGREAHSEFRTRTATAEASLMDVQILTGRTHQIRVHAAYCKHPVVGDTLYGYRRQRHETAHHMLHAWHLAFPHPLTGKPVFVTAPWDAEWERVLKIYQIPLPGEDNLPCDRFELS